jgi:hypothetical protein
MATTQELGDGLDIREARLEDELFDPGPPPLRSDFVSRPDLISRLSSTTADVVTIIAPAGYGTSTTLASGRGGARAGGVGHAEPSRQRSVETRVTYRHRLVIGLLIRSNDQEMAETWTPIANKVSGVSILILLVVGLGMNVSNIVDLIGSFGFLALVIFVVGSLLIGLALGGRDRATRNVMGLGTAQRNVAAAVLVATVSFSGTMTLPYILVASVILPLMLLPTAKRLGRRADMG